MLHKERPSAPREAKSNSSRQPASATVKTQAQISFVKRSLDSTNMKEDSTIKAADRRHIAAGASAADCFALVAPTTQPSPPTLHSNHTGDKILCHRTTSNCAADAERQTTNPQTGGKSILMENKENKNPNAKAPSTSRGRFVK
eukprot:scaffold656874_cov64-Prasinocladus_malaysianus.AAC.1